VDLALNFEAPFDDYMAEVLALHPDEVMGYGRDYERALLVYLTGWTLEEIDGTSVQDMNRVATVLNAIREKQQQKRKQ